MKFTSTTTTNHMPSKVWDAIVYAFLTFNRCIDINNWYPRGEKPIHVYDPYSYFDENDVQAYLSIIVLHHFQDKRKWKNNNNNNNNKTNNIFASFIWRDFAR